MVDTSCYIIADVGSNHCGDLDQAIAHIRVAAECGVSAIKFQAFKVEQLYPPDGTASYLKTDKPLHEILKPFELSMEWVPILKEHCDNYKIGFLCTPFSLEAVDQLNPYVPAWKIASFELNWLALIEKCMDTGKPIILSSGGADFKEIAEGVRASAKRIIEDGKEYLDSSNVALLHCVSKYPVDNETVNLNVINCWIRGGCDGGSGYDDQAWGLADTKTWGDSNDKYSYYPEPYVYGLSDHTEHPSLAPCAAAVLGAKIIEKHYTLRKDLPSPDAKFSLDPQQLKQMVNDIRTTEKMLGSSEKKPQSGELNLYKRTLYATKNLQAGTTLTTHNTVCLRNTGKPNPVPPQAVGFHLRTPVSERSMITTEDLE